MSDEGRRSVALIGRKFEQLARAIDQNPIESVAVTWLREDHVALTMLPMLLTYDCIFSPWRIVLYAIREQRELVQGRTRLVLLTGSSSDESNVIREEKIVDLVVHVSDYVPPSRDMVAQVMDQAMASEIQDGPIAARGRIAFFSYVDPYFSSNSTMSHVGIRDGVEWTSAAENDQQRLRVCDQILYDWKWRNRERHGLMDIKPLFGAPKTYADPGKRLCFAALPFDEPFLTIYADHIEPTLKTSGFECRKADDFFTVGSIMADIWNNLNRAAVVIADITTRNPNVMYEIGIAHTVGKPVVLLTQSIEAIPFDLRHLRHLQYSYTPRGCRELEEKLARTVREAFDEYVKIESNENKPNSRLRRLSALPPRFEE